MFFKNASIYLFLRFLWFGLVLGLILLFFKFVIRVFRKNVYIHNLLMFCYTLLFGLTYCYLCKTFYNFSFCWFGLFGMVLGLILVKISIEFFFTKIISLLYNKFTKLFSRRKNDGELRTSQKV